MSDRFEARTDASPRHAGWRPRPSTGQAAATPAARRGPAVATPDAHVDPVAPADEHRRSRRDSEEARALDDEAADRGFDITGDGLAAPVDVNVSTDAVRQLGSQAIALAGLIVMTGVVVSRLLGWLRTSVFYAEYGGASGQLDAFFAAFRIPDTLFQLVAAGAVGSALVPIASELIARGETERARRVVSTIANLMVIALIPLAALLWVVAPAIVPIIAPSPDPAVVATTTRLTQLMLVSPILLAFGAVISAGLNALGKFGSPSLAPNVYNVAIIICAVALAPYFGIYALGIGVVVGAMGHIAAQATQAYRHRLYHPVLDIHDPKVAETIRLLAPRALGLGATQLVFLVNTFFALSLGDGPNSIFTGAFTILLIPVGMLGVPFGIVLLPPLSRAIASGDVERFRRLAEESLRVLVYLVVPLTVLMAVLATPIIALLYQHGHFSAANTATMAPVLLVLLLGLPGHVAITLVAPIFYARKDTRTPVAAALLFVAVNVVGAIVLFPMFQLSGLAAAMGLGAYAEVGILTYLMGRDLGLELRRMAFGVASYMPGAALAGAAAFLVDRLFTTFAHGSLGIVLLIVDLGVATLAAVACYLAWSRLARLDELEWTLGLGQGLVRRFRRR